MDIEYHYYMTYLISSLAGLGHDKARVVAYSSQYVDDNDIIFEIEEDSEQPYQNYISQTMNILKPEAQLFRIYPVFHFIPGDPQAETAWRRDGKMHWMNTTPNSDNANKIFDSALNSDNLYRIGIALHSYSDSWAHQNFIGFKDGFNALDEMLSIMTPNIGHADARHNPDEPARVWEDSRLLGDRQNVDNKERFLDAAEHVLRKLMRFADENVADDALQKKVDQLRKDLGKAVGERDQVNERRNERIQRYLELSDTVDYGGGALDKYDPDDWFDAAIKEDVRGIRDRWNSHLPRLKPFKDKYHWKDAQTCQQSDWYRFQEAVKEQQEESLDILNSSNLRGLELPEF